MKISINYDISAALKCSEVIVVFPEEGECFYNYYLGILQSRYDLKNIQRRGPCISFLTYTPMFYLNFFTDRPDFYNLQKTNIDKFAYSDGGAVCEIWEDAC